MTPKEKFTSEVKTLPTNFTLSENVCCFKTTIKFIDSKKIEDKIEEALMKPRTTLYEELTQPRTAINFQTHCNSSEIEVY